MTTSFVNLKSTALSALMGGLVLIGAVEARSFQDHDHAGHGHDAKESTERQSFAGDAYLLSVDAVSGKALGPIDSQVIVKHEGRQLRFATEKTAAAFRADPGKFLSKIDQKMIAQQLPFYPLSTCVVSGEPFGGEMGEPIDVIYKNRLVRLCCKGCKKGLAKDPAGMIAAIDKAVIAEQSREYPLTTCVVSGEALGAMGGTIDYVVGNRLVRLCCKGCKKDLAKDPVAFLAKLDAAGAGHGDHAGKGHDDDHGGHGHHDG